MEFTNDVKEAFHPSGQNARCRKRAEIFLEKLNGLHAFGQLLKLLGRIGCESE